MIKMMILTHVWSLLCLLMAASAVTVLYPSISGTETLYCKCPDHTCQKVYWYRLLQGSDKLEFLVQHNMANIANHGDNISQTRFKTSHSGTKIEYTLRITGIQSSEAGFYSCVLYSPNAGQDPKNLMPAGYYLRPGEQPPTLLPPTVKPDHKPKYVRPPVCKLFKGCEPHVLWSGVGAVLVLFVTLLVTLYYFSRLPKKCRHGFAKKNYVR